METRSYNYLVHVCHGYSIQLLKEHVASCFIFKKKGLLLCCTSEAIFTHLYRLSISKGLNTIEIVVVDYANDLPVGRLVSQAPL